MGHKTLINGTEYKEISSGKAMVDGTIIKEIKNGKTLVGGTTYELPFLYKVTFVNNTPFLNSFGGSIIVDGHTFPEELPPAGVIGGGTTLTLYFPEGTLIHCKAWHSAIAETYCFISVNGEIVKTGDEQTTTVEYTYTVNSDARVVWTNEGGLFTSHDEIEIIEY